MWSFDREPHRHERGIRPLTGRYARVRIDATRRADRLFDIIQALRGAKRPLTAAALAEDLEGHAPDDLPRHRHAAGAPRAGRGRCDAAATCRR